jgi:hypothetical protein
MDLAPPGGKTHPIQSQHPGKGLGNILQFKEYGIFHTFSMTYFFELVNKNLRNLRKFFLPPGFEKSDPLDYTFP